MPPENKLPDAIQKLPRQQKEEIHNEKWRDGIQRVLDGLKDMIEVPMPPPTSEGRLPVPGPNLPPPSSDEDIEKAAGTGGLYIAVEGSYLGFG